MLVRFVSTDYSSLILQVRFEDGGGEVTSLWALLGRWRLQRGALPECVVCCSEGGVASLGGSALHPHAPGLGPLPPRPSVHPHTHTASPLHPIVLRAGVSWELESPCEDRKIPPSPPPGDGPLVNLAWGRGRAHCPEG